MNGVDDHDLLRKSLGDAFARAANVADGGADRARWDTLVAEGWTHMFLPEGGSGAREVVLAGEEGGKVLLPLPFAENAVIVPWLVRGALGPGAPRVRERIDAGDTFGLALPSAGPGAVDDVRFRCRATATGWRVRGELATPGVGIASSSQLLVAARDESDAGELRLFLIGADLAGVRRRAYRAVDRGRELGGVVLDDVDLPPEALLCERDDVHVALVEARLVGALHTAAELTGVSRAVLDRAVEYAKTREQFGKPIGTFQGVAHPLAHVYVEVTHLEGLVADAARRVEAGGAHGHRAVSAAKACAGRVAALASRQAIQTHGGIGFTWELGLHAYLKRALLAEQLFGAGSWHAREILGGALAERRERTSPGRTTAGAA